MRPSDYGLPYEAWRSGQEKAIKDIQRWLLASKQVIYEAPPGIGKSAVGIVATGIRGEEPFSRPRYLILVSTKDLETQYQRDYPEVKVMHGRNNYPCALAPGLFPDLTAEQCVATNGLQCLVANHCEYWNAKSAAASARTVVANYAYFLAEANYKRKDDSQPSPFAFRFTICDEMDTLGEGHILNYMEIAITESQLARCRIAKPKKVSIYESWVEWAPLALAQVRSAIGVLQDQVQVARNLNGIDFNAMRELVHLKRLSRKLAAFSQVTDADWAFYPGERRWSFKPVWINKYAPGLFFDHLAGFLGMSATIGDFRQFCRNLGIEAAKTAFIQGASIIPAENRPIYYRPVANLSHKTLDTELPKLVDAVTDILKSHPDEKGLCHAVNYHIARYIMANVPTPYRSRLIGHGSSADRRDTLDRFRSSSNPLVLVSPSFSRGLDLPYDDCRFIIIAKAPYMDLGDPRIKKRLYASRDGQSWYKHQAANTVVQMSGRGTRAPDDMCETYLLDAQLGNLIVLTPNWWRGALR